MRGARWVVPVLGLAALAGLSAVFAVDHTLYMAVYMAVLTALMLQPGTTPFIDIAQMPDVVDCWRHGVDPCVTASCDLAGRVFAYSPLWLRFGFLPSDPGATPWLAVWPAMQPELRMALGALTTTERGFLVIGAALLCGCFFAGRMPAIAASMSCSSCPGWQPWHKARCASCSAPSSRWFCWRSGGYPCSNSSPGCRAAPRVRWVARSRCISIGSFTSLPGGGSSRSFWLSLPFSCSKRRCGKC